MKLYILRHGDAVDHGDPAYTEAGRPLTAKGIQRTRFLASALRRMEIRFDVILSSPLTRARQTAEIVARGLRMQEKPALTDQLGLEGTFRQLIDEIHKIRPAPRSLLLVGHEPYLSGLISLLCTGGPNLSIAFKKGALCRMEVAGLACMRCAMLEWILPPRATGLKRPRRRPGVQP